MKKWIKILLVTLGIIAVLVVTTILLLPPIAKNYLEKHSKELVGRQITIEKLRFNVLNGKLRIDQIAMLEPDDSTTFASLGNFYTRIHLLPLLRQRIHIDAVLIDKPYLNVYQDGTSFNFDDLLTRFLTPADTVEKAPSNPWTVDIDDIKIHNGELTYKDMQRNVTWGFNELDIDVPGLHLSGHERTDMGIVFNFSRGGSLRTSLEYDQATADYDLSLLLSNLSLAGTAAYFNQVIDIGSVEGLVTLDLHVKGNANHLLRPAHVRHSGRIGAETARQPRQPDHRRRYAQFRPAGRQSGHDAVRYSPNLCRRHPHPVRNLPGRRQQPARSDRKLPKSVRRKRKRPSTVKRP